MTKSFKAFLSEMTSSGDFSRKSLTAEEAIEYLKNNVTDYLANRAQNRGASFIHRGIWEHDDRDIDTRITIGDSNNFVRSSRNTKSWYALWIDNSPNWKNFPKRLSSYICTTDPSVAEGYGHRHLIFPNNSAKIGICPDGDMWDSFTNEFIEIFGSLPLQIDEFQQLVDNIFAASNKYDRGLSSILGNSYSFSTLKSTLKSMTISEIEKSLNNMRRLDKDDSRKMLENMKRLNLKNLADVYDYILSPNEFKHTTPANFSFIPNREIWIQGECLFVNADNIPHELQQFLYNSGRG